MDHTPTYGKSGKEIRDYPVVDPAYMSLFPTAGKMDKVLETLSKFKSSPRHPHHRLDQREQLEDVICDILDKWKWINAIGLPADARWYQHWPSGISIDDYAQLGLRVTHTAIGSVMLGGFETVVHLDYLLRLLRIGEKAVAWQSALLDGMVHQAVTRWVPSLIEILEPMPREKRPPTDKLKSMYAALDAQELAVEKWLSEYRDTCATLGDSWFDAIKPRLLQTSTDVATALARAESLERVVFGRVAIMEDGRVTRRYSDRAIKMTPEGVENLVFRLTRALANSMARHMGKLVASALASVRKMSRDVQTAWDINPVAYQRGEVTVDGVIREMVWKLKLLTRQVVLEPGELMLQFGTLIERGTDASEKKYTHIFANLVNAQLQSAVQDQLPYDELYGRILRQLTIDAMVTSDEERPLDYPSINPAYITKDCQG